jgi:hypothetical protein
VFSDPREAGRATELAPEIGVHWTRLADSTVVWTVSEEWGVFAEKAGRIGLRIDPAAGRGLDGQLYLVVQVGWSFQNAYPEARTVVDKGRYLVVELLAEETHRLAEHDEVCWAVRPLPVDRVALEVLPPMSREVVPWVQALVTEVSQPSYSAYLSSLTMLT